MEKITTYGGITAYRAYPAEIKQFRLDPVCEKCEKAGGQEPLFENEMAFFVPMTGSCYCERHFQVINHGVFAELMSDDEKKNQELFSDFVDAAMFDHN